MSDKAWDDLDAVFDEASKAMIARRMTDVFTHYRPHPLLEAITDHDCGRDGCFTRSSVEPTRWRRFKWRLGQVREWLRLAWTALTAPDRLTEE